MHKNSLAVNGLRLIFLAILVSQALGSLSGWQLSSAAIDRVDNKIYYGSDAKQNAYPFMVYIRSPFSPHFCSGTLIDRRWVLTAAHCLSLATEVVLGDYTRPDDEGFEQIIPIEQEIVHPGYNYTFEGAPNKPGFEFYDDNDIGLIKLSSPANIRVENVAKIATLKSKSFMKKMMANEKNCRMLGWGGVLKGDEGITLPRRLQELGARFVNETEDAARGFFTYRSEGAMGVEAIYEDRCGRGGVCSGDSGGAIVCRQRGEWVQTGIPIFVQPFTYCQTGVSGAVNVQLYKDWIDTNINA